MDCRLIQSELIAYHFATLGESERVRTDEHLVACTACLRAYLRLKHHIERGASLEDRPSPAARARLRADVEAAFRPSARERVRQFLRRPIPLYTGVGAAAAAMILAGVAPALTRALTEKPAVTEGAERIDTSRPRPESLSFY